MAFFRIFPLYIYLFFRCGLYPVRFGNRSLSGVFLASLDAKDRDAGLCAQPPKHFLSLFSFLLPNSTFRRPPTFYLP